MPPSVGELGHPCDAATSRQKAFGEHHQTRVFVGQPKTTDDWHWKRLTQSAWYRLYVPCLGCGAYQLIDWSRMVFDESDSVKAHADCYMRCVDCEHQIRDLELPAMLSRHVWASTGGLESPPETINPDEWPCYPESRVPTRIAGFWLPSFYWFASAWGSIAQRWVEARGNPDQEKSFRQDEQALATAPVADEMELAAEQIEAHIAPTLRAGIVPKVADVLITTVDVQGGYVYYLVQGWRIADGATWIVEIGTTKALKDGSKMGGLDEVARLEGIGWPREDTGEAIHSKRIGVDYGYMPDYVWGHCYHYGVEKWRPVKGSPFAPMIWNHEPEKKAGRYFWPINVNEAKTTLWRLLQIPNGEPGHWHLPGLPREEGSAAAAGWKRTLRTYCRHMASEAWDSSARLWKKRKLVKDAETEGDRAGRNDWWDCSVYQVALAISLGVKIQGGAPDFQPRIVKRRKAHSLVGDRPFIASGGRSGSWVSRR